MKENIFFFINFQTYTKLQTNFGTTYLKQITKKDRLAKQKRDANI